MVSKRQISPGDGFVKVGRRPTKWIVDRILDYHDLPRHVRLREEGGNERTITVAISALEDKREFTPLMEV